MSRWWMSQWWKRCRWLGIGWKTRFCPSIVGMIPPFSCNARQACHALNAVERANVASFCIMRILPKGIKRHAIKTMFPSATSSKARLA